MASPEAAATPSATAEVSQQNTPEKSSGSGAHSPDARKPPQEDCGCGDTSKNAPVTDTIPTAAVLAQIADLEVQDADGKSHTFKSIVEAEGADRHMIIFIRHFFCGHCQEYTTALSQSLSLPPRTRLSIIGCGSHEVIPMYSKTTANTFPLYADPSQKLYKALDMIRTKGMGDKKPDYIKSSLFTSVFRSVAQGLGSGNKALKGGDFWQVGGEFLFVRPAAGEQRDGKLWPVTWAHRMRNTRDHAEISDIKKVLGITG